MGLKEQNLINYNTTINQGQRLIKIGNSFIPVGTSLNSSTEDYDLYVVVNDNGQKKVQKLSFQGTTASDDGNPETLQNIKIFNTGHPEPSGTSSNSSNSINFYKCTSVDSTLSTWAGYKANLNENTYIYQEQITSGLTYTNIKPKINNIYSENLLIKVSSLNNNINIPTGYIFSSELNDSTNWTSGGNASIVLDQIINQNVFSINGSNGYFIYSQEGLNLPHENNIRSMSFWCRKMDHVGDGWAGIGYGNGHQEGIRFTFGIKNDYPVFTAWADDYFQESYGLINDTNWHHYVLTFNSTTIYVYKDTNIIFHYSPYNIYTSSGYIHVGDFYQQSFAPIARFSKLKIYNRILSTAEIQSLYEELY